MKTRLQENIFLALTTPLVLAGAIVFLLGWPVRRPDYSAVFIAVSCWFTFTVFLGFWWRKRKFSAPSVGACAFFGFAFTGTVLIFIFLVPAVTVTGRGIYFDYRIPVINHWFGRLARRLGNRGY